MPLLTTCQVGIIIGVAYLVSFAISVGAIIQPTHVTLGLVVLNWALLVDAIITLVVGTIIWFYTLQERVNFQKVFEHASNDIRQKVQDQVCPHPSYRKKT